MNAADVQTTPPRLAVSALPSMLMSYLTGPASNDGASTHDSRHHHDQFPETLSLPPSQQQSPKQLPLGDTTTPRSSRAQANRNSLPLMLGDTDDEQHGSREGSLMSASGKSKRRSYRPKTSYSINHAPPKGSARHKIHVRARPLLQLHQLSASSRPMPAFELLPSAIFSPSLSRAIAKAFRTRHGLCPADLAIVKAENYHQHEASPRDEDESRDVLALFCKGRKSDGNAASKAKLFLEDGSEWEAYPLPNGGYEFFSTDDHGLGMTARWVPRRPRARRSQSASELTAPLSSEQSSKKFTFSTISPNSRRHPIIASLTSTSLEINNSYTVPSALAPSPEISPPGSDHEAAAAEPVQSAAGPIETAPSLKTLITATAIWVTLREGWCPGYRYDDLMLRSPSLKLNSSPTMSATEAVAAPSKDDVPKRSGSIARVLRSATALKRRSTSSVPVDGSFDEPSISRGASTRLATRRPRAESTSTVIVHSKRPRGRRANTASTTASSMLAIDQHHHDMTEEEESIEHTAAMLAKSSKHSSAPTPLIPPLDSADDDEQDESTAVTVPAAAQEPASPKVNASLNQRSKRASSATSSNMSIDAKKAEANSVKQKKGRRLRSLFCGLRG